MAKITVAAVQTDPKLGRVPENLDRVLRSIREAGTQLVVLPECALSGYGFSGKEEAVKHAEPVPGPSTGEMVKACLETGAHAIVGMLETERDHLYNTSVLMGPSGVVGKYRKTHMVFLGVDRFTTPGDLGLPVFETPLGKIGMLICYDGGFPEATRCLKLAGAHLVCLSTNWPVQAEVQCRYSPMMRSQENHVNFLSADRVGSESGFTFRGESKICDFDGVVLAEAGREEEIIRAEVDMAAADANRVVNVPGEYEFDRVADRRPDLYGPIGRSPTK